MAVDISGSCEAGRNGYVKAVTQDVGTAHVETIIVHVEIVLSKPDMKTVVLSSRYFLCRILSFQILSLRALSLPSLIDFSDLVRDCPPVP